MPNLETDLSASPYFDDFTVSKNYYQILFKPSVAVQTREINQLQTTLQDQIDKFGRSIYKDGSVIEGCAFSYDNNYTYVKIKDNYTNNYAISSIADFTNQYVTNPNGLKALVINTVGGYESQDPDLNTLYIKYLNSANFPNGATQQTFTNTEILTITSSANVLIGNVTVATVNNSTGTGYAFTTGTGTIFKKGYFLSVPAQTLIISKYSNYPDGLSVGFNTNENIITALADSTLYDNALGSPNFSAPGANRLQIIPTLSVVVTPTTNSSSVTSTSFFSICDFVSGSPVTIKQDPQYTTLGKELARRTYETSGDFVVKPFNIMIQPRYEQDGTPNTTYSTLQSSPGVGYVGGYRVEFINQNNIPIRKGTDEDSINNQTVALSFGNYLIVNEFCGDFRNDIINEIELHNTAYQAITNRTFLGTSYTSANKIGIAYVRSVVYNSGTPGIDATYRVYLSDTVMNPGQNFSSVKSIVYNNGGFVNAVGDVILQPNFQGNSVAVLQNSSNEIMIQFLGQKAIDWDGGFSNQQYIYRNKLSSAFQLSTGISTFTLPAAYGTGSEEIYYNGGSLSSTLRSTFMVLPIQNGYSSNLTGTVSTSSTTNTVTGSSTTFLANYTVGDYILVDGAIRRVISISNNTSLSVDSNFVTSTANNHQIVFPAGVPIDFLRPSRSISTSNNTISLNLGLTPNANFNTTLYFDVLRYSTVPINKKLNQTYVKLDLSNNSAGIYGPWCLGLPDVINVAAVYIGTNGTYDPTTQNQVSLFNYSSGQNDSYYGLGYLSAKSFIANSATSLLCLVNHFTYDTSGGVGYFNVSSYPIDQNPANTSAIRIQEVPIYTTQSGQTYDLRDCIDYRPFVQNTAISNTSYANGVPNASLATINPSSNLTFSITESVSYMPTPDSVFETNLNYYMSRIDRVSITSTGQMIINEGVPDVNPTPPPEGVGTSTIALVTVPPWPSLSQLEAKFYNRYDYSYQITPQQIVRYTMKDIKSLDDRIKTLEYYTSLSLIEQQTQNLNVQSSNTGLNRFKNGILVDPFIDFTISNTLDPEFNIAIDPSSTEARPTFSAVSLGMEFNANLSQNVSLSRNTITLNYKSILFQSQTYASLPANTQPVVINNYYTNITSTSPNTTPTSPNTTPTIVANTTPPSVSVYYDYNGILHLSGNLLADYSTNPIITDINGLSADVLVDSTNWIVETYNDVTPSSYGTLWGFWAPPSPILPQKTASATESVNIQLTSNTSAVTQSLISSGSSTAVTSPTVNPWIESTWVIFEAYGMRPNTPVYVYFDFVNIQSQTFQLTPFTVDSPHWGGGVIYHHANSGIVSTQPTRPFTYDFYPIVSDDNGDFFTYGDTGLGSLSTDGFGNCFGAVRIPPATFSAIGDHELLLCDNPNLSASNNSVTTQASAFFPQIAIAIGNPVISGTPPITTTNQVQSNIPSTTSVLNNTVQPTVANTSTTVIFTPFVLANAVSNSTSNTVATNTVSTSNTTQITTLNITNTLQPTTVISVSNTAPAITPNSISTFVTSVTNTMISSNTSSAIATVNPGTPYVALINLPSLSVDNTGSTGVNSDGETYYMFANGQITYDNVGILIQNDGVIPPDYLNNLNWGAGPQ